MESILSLATDVTLRLSRCWVFSCLALGIEMLSVAITGRTDCSESCIDE